jgi:heat shock protein HslJ
MKTAVRLCLCLALALGGCKTQKTPVSFSGLNGEWDLIELNGTKLRPEETVRRLAFDTNARRLSGNAGCNQISGHITYGNAQKGDIKFHGVASTRKACLDMRTEDALLKALGEVIRFNTEASGRKPQTAIFYGADNQRLFVVSRHIAKE